MSQWFPFWNIETSKPATASADIVTSAEAIAALLLLSLRFADEDAIATTPVARTIVNASVNARFDFMSFMMFECYSEVEHCKGAHFSVSFQIFFRKNECGMRKTVFLTNF